MALYDSGFYDSQEQGSVASARVIVPYVLQLLQPKSVADIGCGVGTWLSVYAQHGVKEILGIDGEYVDQTRLYIDQQQFMPHDLSKPIALDRTFDLVQSLEVAEHIDQTRADQFVETITSLGKAVLFGAAIPYQLGTGHINEQYVDYWIPLFEKRGYHPVDCIRPQVWNQREVEVWYRQNTLLFLHEERYQQFLLDHPGILDQRLVSVVHPELYELRISMLLKVISDIAGHLQGNKDWQLAEQLYKLVLHHDDDRAETHVAVGQLMAKTERWEAALEALNKAITINDNAAPFYFIRGSIYNRTNKNDLARQDFHQALKVDANYSPARDALARLEAN